MRVTRDTRRCRSSRLKGSICSRQTLWDFESTFVWKLLKSKGLAGRSSNRSSSIQSSSPGSRSPQPNPRRTMPERLIPISNLRCCFLGHVTASAAKRLRSNEQSDNYSGPQVHFEDMIPLILPVSGPRGGALKVTRLLPHCRTSGQKPSFPASLNRTPKRTAGQQTLHSSVRH
jgi:hypothetical protein